MTAPKTTILFASLTIFALGCAEQAVAPDAVSSPRAQRVEPLFTNSGFEAGNLSSWAVTTGLIPSQVPIFPVTQESDLGITAGGSNLTSVDFGAPYSLIPFGLTAADKARYPRFGSYAAVVNEGGFNRNTNKITQSSVVTTADIDPIDGLVHVRFTVLPVLQNPGHTLRQQPFYYVTILNQTKGTVLASRFNFSNEAGVPWQTNLNTATYGMVVYTDWLLFDLPLSRAAVSIGDTLVATVIAGGCGPSGHWGEAIVDSFGSTIPGLVVYGSGPDSVEAGTDFQYTYRLLNGSAATASGVKLTSYLPAGTTFRSVDTPGVSCAIPPVGARGTVACDVGSIGVGGQAVVKVTVRADTTAASPIRHGWYYSESNQEQPLIGPVVVTNVTTGGTTQYVDLVTSVDDTRAGVSWGDTFTYSVTVRNKGPATATGALITTNAPPQLTVQNWTCTPLSGATCGAATGTGALSTSATLPAGGSVSYTIEATVIAGSGPGLVSFTANATAPAGTVERFSLDNGAGDDNAITDGLALVTVNRDGAGLGTIVSVPAGLTCGAGCTSTTGSFAGGTPVTFQAVPAAGSVFTGWSGGVCTGLSACTFTVGVGQTVTGTFALSPVSITSPLTATAAVGQPFSYTLTALGTAPVTLGAAGLPAWASFDLSTGIISGTPPAAGTTNVTVTATDSSGTDTQTLVITAGNAPTITSALTATVGAAGNSWAAIRVQASGDATIQYNASNLPGTVTFNTSTGYFGGASGATGVFNLPIVATNDFGSDFKVLAVSVGGAPVITSALSASGTVGTPFSYQLTATGTAPLTFGASGLPSWASFDAATGVLSGTPSSAGASSIGLSATNGIGTSTQTLVLTVDGPAIITSALTASGTAGEAFSYSLTAEGTAPITRAMSGLPAWATFEASTGLLSGTPPAAGTFTPTMTASNAVGTDTQALVITIASPPPTPTPPVITSAVTDTAFVGEPFAYAVTATGQVPMTFAATGLPGWASLDVSTGALTGTPTGTGSHPITFTVTNALGQDTETLTLAVVARPSVTSALTASAVVGEAFSYALTATGTGPLTLAVTGLPSWASFEPTTGLVTGTPSTPGLVSVTVQVSSPYGTDAKTLVVTVRALPVITSALSASAVVGQPFSYTVTATGTTPITFAATGLPAWASLDPATGVLSGTPDADAVVAVGLTATNAAGADSKTLTLTARTAPTITNALTVHGAVGLPFSFSFTATGTAVIAFSVSGEPAGLSLTDATLSGTPTAAGTSSVIETATNLAGSAQATVTVVIRAAIAQPTIVAPVEDGWVGTTTPTVSGSAPVDEAGNAVRVSQAGVVLCETPIDAAGSWSCVSSELAIGAQTLTAVIVDTHGLVGTAADTQSFTVDIAAPAGPTWTAPAAGAALKDATPELTGEAEANAHVIVTQGANVLCTATADTGGLWSCTPTTALPDGTVTLTATQTDLAGNSSPGADRIVTIDTDAPSAPSIVGPAEGAVVSTSRPTIYGQAEPGATVTVELDGQPGCTATADSTGAYACAPSNPLDNGPHTATVTATDAAGNPSPAASTHFTVDGAAPDSPTVTGVPSDGGKTADNTPTLEGTAEPGTTVEVKVDGVVVCTTTADAAGHWSCPPLSTLSDGVHGYSVTATDGSGNVSAPRTGTFDVQTATGSLSPPSPGRTTENGTVEGTATPGATVNIYVDGEKVATTTADADGHWTAPLPLLPPGEHHVSVGVENAEGVEVYRSPEQRLDVVRPVMDLGGGIGCSQSGGSPAGLLALLALGVLLRARSRRGAALGVATGLAVLGAAPAWAQATTTVSGFELEQLVLNPAARAGLVVGGSDVLPPAGFRLALALGYENSPLKYLEDGVWRSTPVEHRWTAFLTGAVGLTPWLELGAMVPVVLYQNGQSTRSQTGELVLAAPSRGAAMGTPWVQARFGLFRERDQAPLDLGLTLMVGLPVGSPAALTSDGSVSAALAVGAGRTFGPIRLAAEVGGLWRPSTALLAGLSAGASETVGSRLTFGLGASTTGSGLRGEVSARGLLALTNQPFSAEVLAGVRYPIESVELFALAGPGFGNAPGTPVVRALVGVAFGGPTARPCADGAGDVARCPENDADGDGVKNGVDRCPTEAGPASEAGCPVLDGDRDGVPDSSDACPTEPGPMEAHGCPPPPPAAPKDSDADGVADDVDACPELAGDAAHGGCPAPPVAAPEQVELKSGRFELKGKVYFDTNRAIVQERSFALLDEVAAVMKAHPEVTRVAIDGHTDSVGGEAFNQRLSEARARAVRDYLMKAGIEGARLEPRGFGASKPLASNATPAGREQNRRVEFIVIEE